MFWSRIEEEWTRGKLPSVGTSMCTGKQTMMLNNLGIWQSGQTGWQTDFDLNRKDKKLSSGLLFLVYSGWFCIQILLDDLPYLNVEPQRLFGVNHITSQQKSSLSTSRWPVDNQSTQRKRRRGNQPASRKTTSENALRYLGLVTEDGTDWWRLLFLLLLYLC